MFTVGNSPMSRSKRLPIVIGLAIATAIVVSMLADREVPDAPESTGSVQLSANKPGTAVPPSRADSAGSPTSSGEIRETTGYSIAGSVVDDETGFPVENFSISLFRGEKFQRTSDPEIFREFADDNGTFRIDGIDFDHGDMLIRAPGFSPATRMHVEFAHDPGKQHVALRPARTLFGRVIDASTGSPVDSATVHAYDAERSNLDSGRSMILPGLYADTGADGSFVLDEIPPGRAYIYTIAPGYLADQTNIDPGAYTELLISMRPGARVSGTILGIDGSPIIGATTTLTTADGGSRKTSRSRTEAGFTFEGLEAGDYRLSGHVDELISEPIEFSLQPAQHLDDLVVQLRPGAIVTGQVSGLLPGESVVRVLAVQTQPGTRGTPVDQRSAQTGDDGSYTIRGLRPESANVRVSTSSNRLLMQNVDLSSGRATVVNFQFQGSVAVDGRVTPADERRRVIIHVVPDNSSGPTGEVLASSEGYFHIGGLAPGRHTVYVNREPRREINLTGPMTIDIEL